MSSSSNQEEQEISQEHRDAADYDIDVIKLEVSQTRFGLIKRWIGMGGDLVWGVGPTQA